MGKAGWPRVVARIWLGIRRPVSVLQPRNRAVAYRFIQAPWEIARRICAHTRICYATSGFIAALALWNLAGLWLAERQITPVTIRAAIVQTIDTAVAERRLIVHQDSVVPTDCVRLSCQYLYRPNAPPDSSGINDDPDEYIPMGCNLNGNGFPGSKTPYRLLLSIPSGLDPGTYTYRQRSYLMCKVAGIISADLKYSSDPVPVDIK